MSRLHRFLKGLRWRWAKRHQLVGNKIGDYRSNWALVVDAWYQAGKDNE